MMLSRSKAAFRVDFQHGSACFWFVMLPAWTDIQLFADRKRLEILFPVIRPVFFLDARQNGFQSAKFAFGIGCLFPL